jgi:Leucine-rich repeat (LRR) protein
MHIINYYRTVLYEIEDSAELIHYSASIYKSVIKLELQLTTQYAILTTIFLTLYNQLIITSANSLIKKDAAMKILLCYSFLITILITSCSADKEIARALSNPEETKKINLKHCGLTKFPMEILQCKNLEELDLYGNKIDSIPQQIFVLRKLRILSLSKNRITKLPSSIGSLEKLRELHLQANKLTALPPEIEHLDSLIILNVEYNNLRALPPEIGGMQNLRDLYLSYNNIRSIPKEISNLKNLQYFIVGRNALEPDGLPNELGKLKKLRTLDVAGSGPMLRIPDNLAYINTLDIIYVDRTAVLPYTLNPIRQRPAVIIK